MRDIRGHLTLLRDLLAIAQQTAVLTFSKVQAVLAQATGPVSFNGQQINNLAAPTSPADAATKAYADAIASGVQIKQSVKAIATATIVLSGVQTIDGVNVIDRVPRVDTQAPWFALELETPAPWCTIIRCPRSTRSNSSRR